MKSIDRIMAYITDGTRDYIIYVGRLKDERTHVKCVMHTV